MSLSESFHPAPHPLPVRPDTAGRRPAPFSLRLSDSEKAELLSRAGGQPLGGYIKARLFAESCGPRPRSARLAVRDKEALAKLLALLGRSRLANNLNQLAYAANIGALPLTPETEADLRAALAEVREMRELLLVALGLKPEDSPSFAKATEDT